MSAAGASASLLTQFESEIRAFIQGARHDVNSQSGFTPEKEFLADVSLLSEAIGGSLIVSMEQGGKLLLVPGAARSTAPVKINRPHACGKRNWQNT